MCLIQSRRHLHLRPAPGDHVPLRLLYDPTRGLAGALAAPSSACLSADWALPCSSPLPVGPRRAVGTADTVAALDALGIDEGSLEEIRRDRDRLKSRVGSSCVFGRRPTPWRRCRRGANPSSSDAGRVEHVLETPSEPGAADLLNAAREAVTDRDMELSSTR